MQTEMMSRLLKDGKIIERRWEIKLRDVGDAIDAETKDQLDLWGYEPDDMIILYEVRPNVWSFRATSTWDAIEQGIKIGDEWIFEGDRVEPNDPQYRSGVVEFSNGAFRTHRLKDNAFDYFPIMGLTYKHIGNIHDKEKG